MLIGSFGVAALRIGFGIVFDTAALVVWDIGTRSPAQLIVDVRTGLRNRVAIVRGSLRLLCGALALALGYAICAPAALRPFDSTVVEGGALVIALILEQLIGPGLRARRRSH